MHAITRLRTAVRRKIRYSGLAEWLLAKGRRATTAAFPEISLNVDLKPGDIAIDCGAHVGDVTSRMARTGATVYAFEPNPRCFAVLERRFSRMRNVVLHNCGAMAEAGKFTLRIPVDDDVLGSAVAGTFLPDANSFHQDEDQLEVTCIAFPDFLDELDTRVKLLKMDIEGAEVDILNRLLDRGLLAKIDLAIVETHDRFSADLALKTNELRCRLKRDGVASKVRLDWV